MRLEAASQGCDEYLSTVASELRAPLRSVLNLARLLGEYDGVMDAVTREYADYIRASAEHMSFMLNNLRRPSGAGQRSMKAGPRGEAAAHL